MNFTKESITGNSDGLRYLKGKSSWKAVARLIEKNPYSERICFLLTNPHLATVVAKDRAGRMTQPNCIGTALFVAAVTSHTCPFHGYDRDLAAHMKRQVDYGENKAGHFIFSYSVEQDDWHAGIYLGHVEGNDIAFSQRGVGRSFAAETVSGHYCSPDFYIPSTWGVAARKCKSGQ